MAKRSRDRVTLTPTPRPPQLFCPSCEMPLVFRESATDLRDDRDRRDRFACRTCGTFEYRHRTGTLVALR
jgi:RNase P subunit RPR2